MKKKRNQRSVSMNTVAMRSVPNSSVSKTRKAHLRSRAKIQKLTLNQARTYILYSLGCFLASQFVKFFMYSVLYRGDQSPTGFTFLLVVYIQTGLLLFTFIFFVLAVFKALQRLARFE